eukprot:symbB.v1.2.013457.t1/scaffold955.1/size149113/10
MYQGLQANLAVYYAKAGRRGLERKNAPKVFLEGQELPLRQALKSFVTQELIQQFRATFRSSAEASSSAARRNDQNVSRSGRTELGILGINITCCLLFKTLAIKGGPSHKPRIGCQSQGQSFGKQLSQCQWTAYICCHLLTKAKARCKSMLVGAVPLLRLRLIRQELAPSQSFNRTDLSYSVCEIQTLPWACAAFAFMLRACTAQCVGELVPRRSVRVHSEWGQPQESRKSPTAKARRHVPPQQMAFYAQNNMKICGSCVARPNWFCHAQTHTQRGSTCVSFWILLVLPALIEVTRRTPGQDLVTWGAGTDVRIIAHPFSVTAKFGRARLQDELSNYVKVLPKTRLVRLKERRGLELLDAGSNGRSVAIDS